MFNQHHYRGVHIISSKMVSKEHRIPMENEGKLKTWFKRLGWAAFWFFVIKGTITTIIILFIGKKAWDALF